MGNKLRMLDRLVNAADIPDEPMPGLPLVEIAGERRVLIENHYGVTQYSTESIRVQVKFGQICVCGSHLVLSRMMHGRLIITGNVDSVQLLRGCK